MFLLDFCLFSLTKDIKKVLLIKQFNILHLYSSFHPKGLNTLCLYSFINHTELAFSALGVVESIRGRPLPTEGGKEFRPSSPRWSQLVQACV